MATPRKHWFRTADALLREPMTRSGRSTYLGLAAWLNQRRARDGHGPRRACEASIPPGDLLTITLAPNLEEARKLLSEIEKLFGLYVEARGQWTFVRWRKLAKFQGWEAPDSGKIPGESRAELSPRVAPSDSDSDSDSDSGSGKKNTRASRSPPSIPPWALLCSEILIELLRSTDGARIPRGARNRWAHEIAAIPREVPSLLANGADPAPHIEAGIRWALGPENLGREYEVVIRSGKALKEKWPKLVAAARRYREKGRGKREMDAWVKSYETS